MAYRTYYRPLFFAVLASVMLMAARVRPPQVGVDCTAGLLPAATVRASGDVFTVGAGITSQFDVAANDFTSAGRLAVEAVTASPQHGRAVIHPQTGMLQYTPHSDFNGTDVIAYRVGNGCRTATATVSLHVVQSE